MNAAPLLALTVAALATAALGVARPAEAHPARHLRLLGSIPAKDTVLTAAPATMTLWFSEAPQLRLTRLALAGPGGAVALGKVTVDPKDAKRLTAAVTAAMPAGSYVLSWRTASSDGHAIRGEIPFRLGAAGH